MRTIDHIIIHCSATPPNWMDGEGVEAKRDEIDRWHKERGWRGFGYHALIDRDGSIAQGRPFSEQGAHARGLNAHSIGVCLVGGAGSNENDDFEDHYTARQDRALRMWLREQQARFPGIKKVTGHNQHAAKACPGFRVPLWLAEGPQEAPAAPSRPDPQEQPQGIAAAILALLARIFGGKA